MSINLINIDRETPMLFPVDMRDWIPSDDMVHFVIESVQGMDLKKLHINKRGSGSAQYPPKMMLSLLIYCYANGIFSSRRIERATYRDIAVRYLTADTHPDHDTICKFRRENFEAIAESFIEVLQIAKEMKILKVGTVSTDGTKIKSNASKHKNVTYSRAGKLINQLELDIDELMKKAEEADNSSVDEGQKLPSEITRREKLHKKLSQVRKTLEQRAKSKAKAEQKEYERKVRDREQRKGSKKGKKIKPPKDIPEPDQRINLVDSDSRIMRKSKSSEYKQSYNAQATVDADGSQLILSARISQCASDRNELASNIESIPECIGKPSVVLGDNGYVNEKLVNKLENDNIEVYVSPGAEAKNYQRKYDYRSPKNRSESKKKPKAPWLIKMKEKLQTDKGKELYSLRKQTVEPVFGIIKNVMGFKQFLLRGLNKVEGEWNLIALAYNFKRLYNIKSVLQML